MTAIVERMSDILTTNTYTNAQGNEVNYQTDIGTRVEEGRISWQQEELPAISVFQGRVTIDDDLSADEQKVMVCRVLPVMIQCFFEWPDDNAEGGEYMRKVLSDIHAAIRVDTRWTVDDVPQALRTDEKAHGPEYNEGTFEVRGTQTEIEIRYYAPTFSMED